MEQMNVSITGKLADYIRRKVKNGHHDNASEVVCEALRRMEDEDKAVLRLAKPTADCILAELTEDELDGIRRRVRAGIADIEDGRFTVYAGREGQKNIADGVKARGRARLRRTLSGP
jgi:putative addiction module CopG family antidote